MQTTSDWARMIEAYLSENEDITRIRGKDIAIDVLGLAEEEFTVSEQRAVGKVMRDLGWIRGARRLEPGGDQVMCYSRPGEWDGTKALRDGKIPDGHVLKGVSTLVGKDGEIKQQWQKTYLPYDQLLEKMKEMSRILAEPLRGLVKPTVATRANYEADVLTVYPMGDPHIGMYAWFKETGADFDCDIAEQLMLGAVNILVDGALPTEEALVINVGDYFHADNAENRTTRSGHVLDVDTRWPRVLRIGVNIERAIIAKALKKHKRVTVINAPGNHDDLSAISLNMIMQAYYERESRVIIPDNYTNFLKYRFGKVLIGVHHGHDAKLNQLPGIMASEWPQDWGECEYRYWITGHIHHRNEQDLPGCVVESLRVLPPRDKWAASKGYNSPRDMHRISYHREYGRLGREEVNVKMIMDQLARRAA